MKPFLFLCCLFLTAKSKFLFVFYDANRLKAIFVYISKVFSVVGISSKLPAVLGAWVRQRAIILCFGPKFGLSVKNNFDKEQSTRTLFGCVNIKLYNY